MSVKGLKNPSASESVNLDYGVSQRVSFRLNVKKGYEVSKGRIVSKGIVLILAGGFRMGSNDGKYAVNTTSFLRSDIPWHS